ncbi:glyoxalase [Runella sp.]|uniref:glyoxalase n=1 Tax=Runella sp. TaxID=1960881 RepID=UPI003D0B088E
MSIPEQIQNEVLRPILKAQNDLFILLFRHYLDKRKINFGHFSSEDKVIYIEQSIRKDIYFRSLLVGTVIGHFTPGQYEAYLPLEEELNKRIINMLIKRLCSQAELLIANS